MSNLLSKTVTKIRLMMIDKYENENYLQGACLENRREFLTYATTFQGFQIVKNVPVKYMSEIFSILAWYSEE